MSGKRKVTQAESAFFLFIGFETVNSKKPSYMEKSALEAFVDAGEAENRLCIVL